MSVVSPALLRRTAVLALAAGTVFGMSACATRDQAPEDSSAPSSSASADTGTGSGSDGDDSTAAPGATATASAEPTADPNSGAPTASLPIAATCDSILTLDDVYAYSQNASRLDVPVSAATGTGAQIVALGGLHCQIQNNTSGSVINVTVAKLTPAEIEYQKSNAFTTSNPVTTYSPAADEGYFTMGATEGEAQVFVGDYWVVLSGTEFTEPGAVQPLADSTLGHLRG